MAKSLRLVPRTLLVAAFSTALPALASPLATYRDQLGTRARMEMAARARVARIRQLLGTQALSFAGAADARGPFRSPANGTDNGTKNSGSGVIKKFLQKTADELKLQETRERPPTFDPS